MSERVDLLIRDVTALLHDDSGEVGFRPGSSIAVRDGAIVAVLPPGADLPEAVEVIDGRGQVAMPGLINCHTHAAMTIFRGAAEDVSTDDWFNKKIWPMEVNLTGDDVQTGAELAFAEMIASGTTTVADHYFAMDRVAAAVELSGIRANLGWTFFSSEEGGLDRGVDFALTYRGGAGGRITTSLAPHGVYTVDDADLRRTADLGREHDLLVHIHAAEHLAETRASRSRRGITPVAVLHETGVLSGRTLIAHAKGVVPEDVPLLAAAKGRVGVGTAPKGYLKVGERTTPIRLLLAAGVNVGLATDGAGSNNTLDVWEAMMFTSLIQKYVEHDEKWMTPRQTLRLATTGSAAALGMSDVIGRLAAGHRADIILVDLSGPHTQPVHDLAATLVYSARSADISTTIVDGKVLMADRRLLTVDVPAVLDRLRPRLQALTDISHGTTIQEYRASEG